LTNVTIAGSVNNLGDYAFGQCWNLSAAFFQGNSLFADTNVFSGDSYAIVYYLPGATGWGHTFGGAPTAFWALPYPVLLNTSPIFGAQSNVFGFTVSWTTHKSVIVEACTDLANPVWQPLETNSLTKGYFYFSDPEWTNYPGRFYRVTSP
jgi:hypothetical protein